MSIELYSRMKCTFHVDICLILDILQLTLIMIEMSFESFIIQYLNIHFVCTCADNFPFIQIVYDLEKTCLQMDHN